MSRPTLTHKGNPEGYFSVRRKPGRGAVSALADVYKLMLDEERRAGPRDACDASIALLVSVLTQKGVSYEKFILSI